MRNIFKCTLLCFITAAVLLGFAGCSSGGYANREKAPYDYEGKIADTPGEVDDKVAETRKLIRNASITAETKEFDLGLEEIRSRTAELDGYIEGSSVTGNTYYNGASARSASYTLRIPAENLDAFLDGIGEAVHVVSSATSTVDVTGVYEDTELLLASLQTQEASLRAMLENTTDLSYLIQLSDKLTEVRREIAECERDIASYDKQVAYSTVNFKLNEVIEYSKEEKSYFGRLGETFVDSWVNFAEGCGNFLIFLVGAIPTLLVLAAIVTAVILIIRRAVRKSKEKKN